MRSSQNDVQTGLMIMSLLLGLPLLIVVAPLLFYFAVINQGESSPVPATQQRIALSHEGAILATLDAAPTRSRAPRDISGGAAVQVAQAMGYSDEMLRAGERDFLSICSACHGTDARGISGLGKNLTDSEFVQSRTDPELLTFVIEGRTIWDPLNTTGVAMPARGGNPGLTDQDLLDIIAYLRVVSGDVPSVVAEVPSSSTESSTPAPTYDPNAPSPGSAFVPVDIGALTGSQTDVGTSTGRSGDELYSALCEVDDNSRAACDWLIQLISEQADPVRLTDLLTNGSSPFDSSIPPGIFIPQRGGMLLLSDVEIQNLLNHFYGLAGVPVPDGADGSETATGTDDRSGEEIYTALCTLDIGSQLMCEFLIQFIRDQNADDAKLRDLLTNGSSPFDSSIPAGIIIPQRGGMLLLKDSEIDNFIEYLRTLAGSSVGAAVLPNADAITQTAAQNSDYARLSYTGELMGSLISPPRELDDFTLPSTSGTSFTLSDYGGQLLLVYFGYMTCPDVCPATLADLRRAYLDAGEPGDKVQVVFITLDPERDQLDVMERYISAFHEDFIGLRPDSETQLEALKANFGVSSERRTVADSKVGYLIDHSATVFLVGADGRMMAQYPFGVPYAEFENDIQVLLTYTRLMDDPLAATETAMVDDPAREYRIIIPEGTGRLVEQGQDPGIIPLKIELTLGERDILVLENHDNSDFLVGGIWVAPYETVRKQFFEPQTFVGLCTVTVGRDLVEIIVSEPQ